MTLRRKQPPDKNADHGARRMITIFELYQKIRSQSAVAKEVGLSRERIRQLLQKGSRRGLFNYAPRKYLDIPKRKLIADYQKLLFHDAVANANGISAEYLKKLLKSYNLTPHVIESVITLGRKEKCINQYRLIERQLGHPPSTAELTRLKKRYLTSQIRKFWGSIDTFRRELGIPFSYDPGAQGRQNFQKRAIQQQEQREVHLKRVHEYIRKSGPSKVKAIAAEIELSVSAVRTSLRTLIAARKVLIEKNGRSVYYRDSSGTAHKLVGDKVL